MVVFVFLDLMHCTEKLKCPDMTDRQKAILEDIVLNDDDQNLRTIASMSERLGLSKPVLTRAANRLAAQKSVERHRNPADKRQVFLTATPTGHLNYQTLRATLVDALG